ncbi:MAG: HPr family phosphocarrier protein [Planctomycetota bacterium]|nr:HPr family phosphocarrier protein [Planctomycetota bacterium]
MTQQQGEVQEHQGEVVLKNKYGLHARPCTLIAQTAKKFEAQVFLGKDGTEVDAKSIFGMLTLAAECGASLTVRARGADASEAVAKLTEVIGGFQAED